MLKSVLQRLTAANYLIPLKDAPASAGKFRLGDQGLMLLQNLQVSALEALDDKDDLRSTCHYVAFQPKLSHKLHLPKSRDMCLKHITSDATLLDNIRADVETERVSQVAFKGTGTPSSSQPTVQFLKTGSVEFLRSGTPHTVRVFSFFSEREWKYRYLDVLRKRRRFWKRLVATPWNIKVGDSNVKFEIQ